MFTVAILSILTVFNACGSDDDDGGGIDLSKDSYTVELNFDGNLEGYNKRIVILGSSPSGGNANLIDGSSKELPTQSLTDLNYTFQTRNSFSLDREVSILGIGLFVYRNAETQKGDLKITLNVYKKGKLVKSYEETATESQSVKIDQTFN